MKTIKITKEIALTVQKGSIVKVDKKQLELLANYKDCYILVEDEEQEEKEQGEQGPQGEQGIQGEQIFGEDEEQEVKEVKEPKSEVKNPKIKKAEAKK